MKPTTPTTEGEIVRISGPVAIAKGISPAMYEVVLVGKEGLLGEVVQLRGEQAVIQVYEDTTGLRPGEPVRATGASLSVELGPGLMSQIYDGIQRPLPVLAAQLGDFIKRGVFIPGLDHKRRWQFTPRVREGDLVSGGAVIGVVAETPTIEHRVLAPPDLPASRVLEIRSGEFTVEDVICRVAPVEEAGKASRQIGEIRMYHRWPVRLPRPVRERLPSAAPLLTGQRVLDTFFPLAKGGTAAIPGPFGSGKTVTQQQLARWSDAQVVVYIGCGERGNEMTEVLKEFPALKDPRTGRPLMERTILIANTSNMPVAAREASVYTGMALAEYYRDQGYDVALMADSTSRWAEAMREISSRLEEMPGEEGYPAYLATRLAQFYERAGSFACLSGQQGSITVIGAVSPPGGDFSEPVTQNTLRIVKAFFGLDARLAQRRHFPSINWLTSYTLYLEALRPWFDKNIGPDFLELRQRAMQVLQKEAELQDVVQLVGADALPDEERLILETGRLLREVFLQQNAYHPIDAYCSLRTQHRLLAAILAFQTAGAEALRRGAALAEIMSLSSLSLFARCRFEA
ncbi:MAG: V-type ATP synthase subunit A, partial [Planctomycetota bacterium]|nr:V-type ATP synthase subunit A [Planctomycetota bacterium]